MFTTKRKGIIALLCAVFAAALIACAISLAPSASRTAPVYAAEGDVAAIDGTNYTSLQKAIDAAGNTATTITLLANTAESITIASGQDITLALNGKDITVESGDVITNNGTLKITGIALSDVSTGDGYAVSNAGTLVIEGGAYRNDIYSANENVEISGGVNCRLYSIVPADFLADGYTLSYYTAGYFCPYAAASVAQIIRNGVEYDFKNITSANAGAVDGDTITLINDVEPSARVSISKSLTLDLNGYSITYDETRNSDLISIEAGVEVVIKNSNTQKESKIVTNYRDDVSNTYYNAIISKGSDLTVENVTIDAAGNGIVFFGSLTPVAASEAAPDTFNTLNMEGVKVSAYAFALSGNGSSAEDEAWSGTTINVTNSSLNSDQGCAIYQPQYGILNINGEETFIEGSSGIEVRAGILNVNAGTIRANWPEFAFSDNAGGGSSVDGAAIVVSQHSTNLPISVNLNGGTYSSTSAGGMSVYEADLLNDVATDKIEIAIDGGEYTQPVESKNVKGFVENGTFANAFDESFVAEGSVFYPAEDGSYKVVTEEKFETVTDNAGVALMNGVVYDSLADAVDAAPTDGTQVTITLIDTDGDGIVTGLGVKVVEGKNIVIDFDGLTYDVTNPVGSPGTETNGFQLLKGSTVRMMNGTLVSDAALILIQNYCDLTIDDMTLDMSDCGQVQYVISNNSGNTVITGDTTIVAAPNQVAFDIYYWPGNGYTDGVSVTFDKNFIGTVTGTVQYGTDSTGEAEDNWQTNKANLAIENGTFDITFDVYSGDESDAGITVSGGEFSKEFDSAYVAEGSVLYTTDGDSFTVGTDDEAIDAGIAIIIDGIGYAEVPEGVVATVGAEGEVPAGYESLQDAIDAAADGETVKLLKNITVDGRVNIDKSLTLDMQGYKISGGMLYIKGGTTAGNSITVNISNGSVIGPTYGIIVFNDVTLNIKDVNISAGTHNGIFVPLTAYDGDTTVLPSTINIEGGSVSGGNTESTASVAICGVGDNSETATKLIANGTTFTGGTFGITGNGTAHNTYIELNDCVVTGSVGIYHPQDGDLIINGGEITGDVTGIEIRSGTLTVNGGTITGNGDPFESDPNGNGTTTTGAAIAVSQHTTNLPITVTINGGTFNGIRALYEADLQDEVTEGVTIEVTGGTFNGEVYSENCTGFIAGGQFVVKPDDTYLAEGFSGFSEYNGMFVPVTSSTEGTMLEEIEQIRQEIADAIAEVNGALAGGDATTLAESMTKLIDRMNELEAMIGELDESMVTEADLAALRGSVTAAYTAAVSQVRAQLSAQIDDLREAIAGMGDVSAELEELRAAYEAADELLSADIADVSAELEAAISELESAYGEADDAIWNAIYALRDTDSGMTAALWVIGVIAVLALCAGVAGIALAIVRTKRS